MSIQLSNPNYSSDFEDQLFQESIWDGLLYPKNSQDFKENDENNKQLKTFEIKEDKIEFPEFTENQHPMLKYLSNLPSELQAKQVNFSDQIPKEDQRKLINISSNNLKQKKISQQAAAQRLMHLYQNNSEDYLMKNTELVSDINKKVFKNPYQEISNQLKKKILKGKAKKNQNILANFSSQSEKSVCRKNIPRYVMQAGIKFIIEPQNYELVQQICQEESQDAIKLINYFVKIKEQISNNKTIFEKQSENIAFQKIFSVFIFTQAKRWALTGNQLNFHIYLKQIKEIAEIIRNKNQQKNHK